MRHPLNAAIAILAAVTAVMLIPELVRGQGQSQDVPMPPGGFKPPPMAPVKPYKALAVTPPVPYGDASFAAFRKQLADAAERKDRAALAKLVVAQGFFWMQDKDLADKRKSAFANFASAIDLDSKDGSGWAVLTGYASDPTAAPLPEHQSVICAPADPTIDGKAFEALVKATRTEPPDWGYPAEEGIEVRSEAKPNASVIERLGLTLVRVLPDSAPPEDSSQPSFLHIATPSGTAGFVPIEAIAGLGGDEMCYVKDASGWKITGYFGGAAQ
jgi:hypothetical protein